MSLTAQISLRLAAELITALDIGEAKYSPTLSPNYNFANGTGADQANNIFTDERTLTASSTEDLDLAGGLTNAHGTTLTFTKVRALLVIASSGNTNNVLVGGAASNQFASIFGNASDVIVVRPGGMLLLVANDSTGYAVTADTGDLLKIANSAGSTSVAYKIAIIGTV